MPNTEVPDTLKPFIFHGVELNWKDGDKEALGVCPFCYHENKFSVKIQTGQFQCWNCQSKGNKSSFLPLLWDTCCEETSEYGDFAESKGLQPDTLMVWGIAYSIS